MNKQDLRLLKAVVASEKNSKEEAGIRVSPEDMQVAKRLHCDGYIVLMGPNSDGVVAAFATDEGKQLLTDLRKERANSIQKWITASAAVVAALAAVVGVVLQVVPH